MYRQLEFTFNDSREIEIAYIGQYGRKGEKRAPRIKPTPEQVKKNNQRVRAKNMMRLIKANFKEGDLWTTLKYPAGERKEIENVQADLSKFLRQLRSKYKKQNEALKFIYRIELGTQGGIHIHLLVNRIDNADMIIQKLWKHGRVNWTSTYEAGGFKELAEYIVKEPEELEGQLSLFDEPDKGKLIRYSSSRNLVRPKPDRKIYSRRTVRKILEEGPKPAPGYYIDKNSIVIDTNPFTGYSYIHYTEIRIKPKGGADSASKHLHRDNVAGSAAYAGDV